MNNHGMFARINRSFSAFRRAWSSTRTYDPEVVSKELDQMIRSKQLATVATQPVEIKQSDHSDTPSKLDVRDMRITMYTSAFGFMRTLADNVSAHGEPPYGNVPIARDLWLDKLWRAEPILAGAVYSMTAKMTALKWQVTGRRLQARAAAQIFAEAAFIDGWDWGGFIASTAQDFYTRNNGVFWETARKSVGAAKLSRLAGGLAELGHIDSLCCELTGNKAYPVHYISEITGQNLFFQPGEYIHFASMPSPRETHLGIGYCAIDRAMRAAKLLVGLHDYDDEKLSNLPPEGVATVTGLTMDEFNDAVNLWMAKRKQDSSLTFPQVLWLIGSQPGQEVSMNFQPFSTIPESFDRKSVVDQYVATLALCFGVDVREFWPVSGGALGTASESEIQHLKAKGKGPGEFLSIVERFLNGELDQDTQFAFDTQDIEEDANAAAVAKAWIDAFFTIYNLPPEGAQQAAMQQQAQQQQFSNKLEQSKLEAQTRAQEEFAKAKNSNVENKANPRPDKPNGAPTLPTSMTAGVDTGEQMTNGGGQPNTPQNAEQVITKDQFLRLLVDKGVLPDYFINDQRTMIRDTDVRLKGMDADPNEYTSFVWEKGVLKEQRLPAYTLTSPKEPEYDQKALDATLDWLRTKEAELTPEPVRKIRGKPISAAEVQRGGAVTKKTIHDELERWRKDPLLSKYALTPDEEADLLKKAQLS